MYMNKSAQPQDGFTLIEVMVALAILAVVAVAASRVSQGHIHATANLKLRTLAHFVAQNTAADLRISGERIARPTDRQVDMAGQTWQVTLTPAPLGITHATSNTNGAHHQNGGGAINSDAIQLTIAVAPIDEGTVKNTLTDLTLVLANNEANHLANGLGGYN